MLGLLFTFGLALTAEQSLRMIWGTTGLPFSLPEQLRGQLIVGDFIYSYYRLFVLAVAITAVTGCWLLLNKTAFGMVVRAGVRDPEMVRALGISLRPILTAVFALGVALAGLAGVLSAPLAGVQPAMGTEILTATFVVVVIGGLGSFWGVVVAGLLVGAVRGITVYYYPPAAEASMYLLMVLILLFRPRGLMGERIREVRVESQATSTGLSTADRQDAAVWRAQERMLGATLRHPLCVRRRTAGAPHGHRHWLHLGNRHRDCDLCAGGSGL